MPVFMTGFFLSLPGHREFRLAAAGIHQLIILNITSFLAIATLPPTHCNRMLFNSFGHCKKITRIFSFTPLLLRNLFVGN